MDDDALEETARRLGLWLPGRPGWPSPDVVHQRAARGRCVRIAPRTYLPSQVPPRPEHDWFAAVVQGGPGAVLTGEVGCHLQGLDRARPEKGPLVLQAHHRRRGGRPTLRRTRRMPALRWATQPQTGCRWPVAPLARAIADALPARDVDEARALYGQALNGGMTPARLLHEVLEQVGRSAGLEVARRDLRAGGVWSVAEGSVVDLVALSSVLPPMLLNPLLVHEEHGVLGRPDGLLEAVALVVSTDSRRWHAEVAQWVETLSAALTLEVYGLLVLHLVPSVVAGRGRQVLLVLERHWTDRLGRVQMPPAIQVRSGAPAPTWRGGRSEDRARRRAPGAGT